MTLSTVAKQRIDTYGPSPANIAVEKLRNCLKT